MDLNEFQGGLDAQEEGVPVHILGPTGQKTDIVFVIASYESKRVQEIQQKFAEQEMKRSSLGKGDSANIEEVKKAALSIATNTIISWENVEFEGKPLECNPKNVRFILETYKFIAEQVDKAAGDRALFFGN